MMVLQPVVAKIGNIRNLNAVRIKSKKLVNQRRKPRTLGRKRGAIRSLLLMWLRKKLKRQPLSNLGKRNDGMGQLKR